MSIMRRCRRAFTLIEILIVVGIIALLIALLLPALGKARRQAKSVNCKAQLQNIGAAFQMYLNENDGRYPPAPYSPAFNPPPAKTPINIYLQRYVSNVNDVFRCPADEEYWPQYNLSYSYYQELGERKLTETFFYKVLQSSSMVPILWDASNFHGGSVPLNWLFADGHVDHFIQGDTSQLRPIIPPPDEPKPE
jgi:prepilin-type N-terminal cleavage/methylation domain-containing protein/prepilin-type processing-associated H-X9-DG protein